jgi:hypothetical protein
MAVDTTVALAAGTVLALGAALVVLGPLWRGADDAPAPGASDATSDDAPTTRAEGVSAVEALREIEFDRATGKLSDEDYTVLKTGYTRDALVELRAKQGRAAVAAATAVAPVAGAPLAGDPVAGDPVEEALRAYRVRQAARRGEGRTCPVDGAPPEPDAVFCSTCGRFLAGSCPTCGAPCDQEGQRFCAACGTGLAGAVAGDAAAVPSAAAGVG